MVNYTTAEDLVNDILSRAGELTDGTSDFDSQAIQYLNRAYQGIWSGGAELDPEISEVWHWLRKDDQGVLTLNPSITTGTISVTNNSTSVTFSSAPTDSMAGRHFKVDDHADVFIISAHTGGATAATLDSVYTGDTDSAASYTVFQVDYDLATDVLYITSPMIAYQNNKHEIDLVDLSELRRRWNLNHLHSGVPREFAPIGDQKVRFSHFGGTSSTDLIRVEYEYIAEPTDLTDSSGSTPLIPRQYRRILSDWGLYLLLLDKDDSKASSILNMAQRGLRAMAKDNYRYKNRASRVFGRILPRQNQLERFRGPLRTSSGLIIG